MASPSPNPSEAEEGGSEFAEESSGQCAATPQKIYVAPPASQLPSKLQYVDVALGAPGPSGIKQCYRSVKTARRVPTLPRRDETPASPRRARRDRSKRHACSSCPRLFSSPGKLSQHVLSHTGELPFSCNQCEKKFNSKFKLARHNLIHSEARAFTCSVCGKSFNRKDHLTNHIRVHNPVKKLFTCERPDCKKSYTSMMSYRKHAALHSAEEGNLTCEICDEVFTTKQEIVYHLKVHTGSRTIKNEIDKKFTCVQCDRKFFTAKDVRRHLVVHTGRRDFLCPFCPQKFGRKDHLVRHVKNAHPEKTLSSAVASTSRDPPPVVEELPFTDFAIEGPSFELFPEQSESTEPTTVPTSDIIVEMPVQEVKTEPLNPEAEESKSEEYPVVYIVPPFEPELPYLSLEMLDAPGPSGLLRDLLTPPFEVEARPQRLPAFTQAFHPPQSPKPPPPPPPPH